MSISPLGVMHSLGVAPDDVVVSRGLMIWHGTLGASVLPYDMNAFWPVPNDRLVFWLERVLARAE